MQLCSVAHFSVIKIRIGAISCTADCTHSNFDDREQSCIHIEITSFKIPSVVNLKKKYGVFDSYKKQAKLKVLRIVVSFICILEECRTT